MSYGDIIDGTEASVLGQLLIENIQPNNVKISVVTETKKNSKHRTPAITLPYTVESNKVFKPSQELW
jgi:hypothetical protein